MGLANMNEERVTLLIAFLLSVAIIALLLLIGSNAPP
jgi:hypothetical protein